MDLVTRKDTDMYRIEHTLGVCVSVCVSVSARGRFRGSGRVSDGVGGSVKVIISSSC